jgi:hypothetical protein
MPIDVIRHILGYIGLYFSYGFQTFVTKNQASLLDHSRHI